MFSKGMILNALRVSVAARRARAAGVGIALIALACLTMTTLLSACGQKGPLTLPKPLPGGAPASAASAPT